MSLSFPTIIPPDVRAKLIDAQAKLTQEAQLAITNWKYEMPSSKAELDGQVTDHLKTHIRAKQTLMMEWLREHNPPIDHDWLRRTEDQIREICNAQLGYALDYYLSCDQHIPVSTEDSESDQEDLRGRAEALTNGWLGEFLDWALERMRPLMNEAPVKHMDFLAVGREILCIVTEIDTFDLVLDNESAENPESPRETAQRAIKKAKDIGERIGRTSIKLKSLPKHPLIREAKEEISLLSESLCQPYVPAEIELVTGHPENAIEVLLDSYSEALARCGDNLRRIAIRFEVSAVDGLPDATPYSGFPAPVSPPAAEDDEILARMREAIRSRPDGATAKANVIIASARVGQKIGRMALRRLEALGEYSGFARSTPKRFRR